MIFDLVPPVKDEAAALDDHDAALGPADDGGWWVLALRDPEAAQALADVPMSTPTTFDRTRAALRARGLDVTTVETLRDVDTTGGRGRRERDRSRHQVRGRLGATGMSEASFTEVFSEALRGRDCVVHPTRAVDRAAGRQLAVGRRR